MTIAYLPPAGGSSNGWDCPPRPDVPTEIGRLHQRRARLLAALRRALGKRAFGADATVLKRAERVAALTLAYHKATITILGLELL